MKHRATAALCLAALMCATCPAWASAPLATPTALSVQAMPQDAVPLIVAPLSPREEIDRVDELRALQGQPPRFAESFPVVVTPDTDGVWEPLADGRVLWRLRVGSPDAVNLNLGFARFVMPEGGQLLIYSADGSQVVRPFTAADNEDHGELWTPVVAADEVVIEVTLPDAKLIAQLELKLAAINPGYRGFGPADDQPIEVNSGSCNVDVVCPEGDDWRDQIQSVAVYTLNGSWTCSGVMVNNTAFDKTPYFLTADHCGISASSDASIVVYWNYQNSTCRTPGSPASGGTGNGSLSQFQTGSTLRAEYSSSDMTLIELDDDPDDAWEVFFAGWDRSSNDYASAVAIHHPDTMEKRISFEYDPTTTTTYLQNSVPGNGTHIRITDWDLGTTEPGSSGSPLFNSGKRVVGQLHGGYASCTSQTSDWYGRFSVSWNGGGSAGSRLKDWLDPLDTGEMAIDGTGLDVPPVAQNVSQQFIINSPEPVTLLSTDENQDPLDYVVISLPVHGTLTDPQADVIAAAPYTLVGGGNTVIYAPEPGYAGGDGFLFKSNDGNLPPEGGDSNIATVTLTIVNIPPQIMTTSFPDGAVGQFYGPEPVVADGGEGALVWQIVADVPYVESDLGTNAFAEVGDAMGWNGDDIFKVYDLPFAFPFYDSLYTQVRVWSNGMVDFSPHTGSSSSNSTATLIANCRIAPLWDDLRTDGVGYDIFIDTTGLHEVTIRWKARTYSGGYAVNMSVTLHESGAIDFHYGPGNTPITPTVGISDGDGSHYTIASYSGAAALTGVNSIRLKKPDQLSPGLSLNANGELFGVPEEVGSYLPTIRVTDSLGRSDEASIALNVVSTTPGDFDGDGDLDGADFLVFTQCLAGPLADPPADGAPPSASACLSAFDFDGNTRVDLIDFGGLQLSANP